MYINVSTGNDHCRMDSQWNCSNNDTGLMHTGSGDAAICTMSKSKTTGRLGDSLGCQTKPRFLGRNSHKIFAFRSISRQMDFHTEVNIFKGSMLSMLSSLYWSLGGMLPKNIGKWQCLFNNPPSCAFSARPRTSKHVDIDWWMRWQYDLHWFWISNKRKKQ